MLIQQSYEDTTGLSLVLMVLATPVSVPPSAGQPIAAAAPAQVYSPVAGAYIAAPAWPAAPPLPDAMLPMTRQAGPYPSLLVICADVPAPPAGTILQTVILDAATGNIVQPPLITEQVGWPGTLTVAITRG